MSINFKEVKLLYFNYDEKNHIFIKKQNISDFYLSKELLTMTKLLDSNKIDYVIDKDNNIQLFNKN